LSRLFGAAPAALLAILSLGVFWAGCSKDETPVDVTPPPDVELLSIICNPLAPEPGETALLTVQGTGSGGIGAYEWQVSGGTIIDNGTINVSWETPETAGIYRVFVKATVGTANDTASTYIMLRKTDIVETGIRYSLYPNLVYGELYFIGSTLSLSDRLFYGFHAYRLAESEVIQLTTNENPRIDGGFDFVFTQEGLLTSVAINAAEFIRQQAMNVIVFPLVAGATRFVSKNEFLGGPVRKNQHTHPDATADFGMFVWQYREVGAADDGTEDLTNVAFRAGTLLTDPIKILTVAKESNPDGFITYFRNIRPLFTPDETSILYFTEKRDWFEPCIIPIIEGTEPDTASRHLIEVFRAAEVKVSERTVFEWNPVVPTQLGFLDTQGKFCIFDYAAETVEVLGTGVLSFAWSADGKLAGVTDEGVYILEPGQTAARSIFTKERPSDDCLGLNWSPGTSNQRVGFRLMRKGASSKESFSAFVVYSLDDDRWYYASKRIASSSDPDVIFPWMRVVFESFGDGMYAPVPVPTGGGQVVLYYSN